MRVADRTCSTPAPPPCRPRLDLTRRPLGPRPLNSADRRARAAGRCRRRWPPWSSTWSGRSLELRSRRHPHPVDRAHRCLGPARELRGGVASPACPAAAPAGRGRSVEVGRLLGLAGHARAQRPAGGEASACSAESRDRERRRAEQAVAEVGPLWCRRRSADAERLPVGSPRSGSRRRHRQPLRPTSDSTSPGWFQRSSCPARCAASTAGSPRSRSSRPARTCR